MFMYLRIVHPKTKLFKEGTISFVKIVLQVGTADFIEELQRRTFPDALDNDVVAEVGGTQLTLPYLNQTGFRNPILVDEFEGLGLGMPDPVILILQFATSQRAPMNLSF